MKSGHRTLSSPTRHRLYNQERTVLAGESGTGESCHHHVTLWTVFAWILSVPQGIVSLIIFICALDDFHLSSNKWDKVPWLWQLSPPLVSLVPASERLFAVGSSICDTASCRLLNLWGLSETGTAAGRIVKEGVKWYWGRDRIRGLIFFFLHLFFGCRILQRIDHNNLIAIRTK